MSTPCNRVLLLEYVVVPFLPALSHLVTYKAYRLGGPMQASGRAVLDVLEQLYKKIGSRFRV